MIHPNMATMLAFVTTDASISRGSITGMLKKAVDKSYNMMTVDGDTSTNDCLLLFGKWNVGSGSQERRRYQEVLRSD